MQTREIAVAVTEPFDLGLSLEFLRGFSPMAGEQRIAAGNALTKSWLHRRVPIDVTIRASSGSELACVLESPEAIDDDAARFIGERVTSFLSADDDLDEFYALSTRDKAFAPVARRLRGLHHPKFPTPFECACWGVINQRIQRAQARSMKSALVTRFGARGFDAFPEAQTLADASPIALTKAIGNERKAHAVSSVAKAFAKVDAKWLQTAPIADVESWLRAIYGVGDFTSAFVLYRGLGRAIRLPIGDKFVVAARHTYPSIDRATLEKKARAYGKWLGLWSLYLWAATFVRPQNHGVSAQPR